MFIFSKQYSPLSIFSKQYSAVFIFSKQYFQVTIGEDQICAGGDRGKDSCAGDSGSALMMETFPTEYDPRYVQIGVVSFGARRCASQGVPAVYARVSNYLEWILNSTSVL